MKSAPLRLLAAAALLLLLAGCSLVPLWRGLYEGTTTRQRLLDAPAAPGDEPLSYDRYEQLRGSGDETR